VGLWWASVGLTESGGGLWESRGERGGVGVWVGWMEMDSECWRATRRGWGKWGEWGGEAGLCGAVLERAVLAVRLLAWV
jgi:hypothetical protein